MLNKRKLTVSRARELRKDETSAEEHLWRKLRGRRPDTLKFRRQHPVPPYILDFAIRPLKLAIEIDGGTHSTPEEVSYDKKRTEFLTGKEWTVIRFSNSEIYENIDGVLETIWAKTMELKHE